MSDQPLVVLDSLPRDRELIVKAITLILVHRGQAHPTLMDVDTWLQWSPGFLLSLPPALAVAEPLAAKGIYVNPYVLVAGHYHHSLTTRRMVTEQDYAEIVRNAGRKITNLGPEEQYDAICKAELPVSLRELFDGAQALINALSPLSLPQLPQKDR